MILTNCLPHIRLPNRPLETSPRTPLHLLAFSLLRESLTPSFPRCFTAPVSFFLKTRKCDATLISVMTSHQRFDGDKLATGRTNFCKGSETRRGNSHSASRSPARLRIVGLCSHSRFHI